MNAALAKYIASIPPTPAMLAERAYIAVRAPALAELYLRDRHVVAEAFGGLAWIVGTDRPLPADIALVDALTCYGDAALGAELRRAIAWSVALQADQDASDEASDMTDRQAFPVSQIEEE